MPKEFTKWTAEEIDIVCSEYPKGGYRAVQRKLPHRGYNQIRCKAAALSLKVEGRSRYSKPSTEWIDAQIVRGYRDGKPNLSELGKVVDRSRGWVKRRALMLGVVLGKEIRREWSEEEDGILNECTEINLPITAIYKKLRKKGYSRSMGAIQCRVYKLGLGFERDWWSATDTAKAFGVDVKCVLRWINGDLLAAKKELGASIEPGETSPHLWKIKRADIKKFMVAHPQRWDHRRMKIEIMLELLCGRDSKNGIGAFSTRVA